MKICVDVSPAVHRRGGIGRYVQNTVAALLTLDRTPEVVAFYNRPARARPEPPLDQVAAITVDWSDKPWRLRAGLSQIAHRSQDHLLPGVTLFHATDHVLPCLARIAGALTVYDLTFIFYPETQTTLNRWFLKLMLPWFLRAADAVITTSESTRRDLRRVYPASQADVHVVYGGVTGHFRPASADAVTAVRNKYRLPDRFILFVGTIEPRKNLTQLLDACRVLKDAGRAMPLVVAGRKGWRSEVFFDRLHQSGLAELTVLTGFVPDEDLPALYSAADVFVFPSLYEGFGLPVLEAMACGTPVITTNVSSLPEVAGPAAILVDPGDCRELAAAVQRLAADPALRREMSVKGTRQAGSFSWEGTARRTLQVYQDALRLKGLDDASDG